MEKKKLLFLIGSINLDGTSIWQLTLCKYLNPDQFDVKIVVFTKIYHNERVDQMLDQQFAQIEVLNSPTHKLNPLYYLKLRNAIKKYNPDLIVNSNLQLSSIVRVIAKTLSKKDIIVYHLNLSNAKTIIRLQDELTRNLSIAHIGVSKVVGESVFKNAPEKIFSIGHSTEIHQLPVDKMKYLEKFGLQKANRIFLNVGRLQPVKNQENLIRAFAAYSKNHPEDRLIIAGWGSEEKKLKELVKTLAVEDKVLLVGAIHDIWNLFAIADFFILTSISEGFGIVLIEAMSFGLPLVITDLKVFEEIVQDNAVLINGFDAKGIQEAFDKTSTLSKVELEDLSKNSINKFKTTFDPNSMTKKYENIFLEIIEK